MKVQKVNGLYRKPRLRADTKVPLLVWVILVVVPASLLLVLLLKTSVLQDQLAPDALSIRKKSVRLVVVGDVACAHSDPNFNDGNGVVNACKQKDVGYAIENENADAVLFLGDIQYMTGDYIDYERSFIPYFRDIKVPVYSVAGNHDYGNGQRVPDLSGYKKAYDLYFTRPLYQKDSKTYFNFNLASWQFYALDSNCEYVGGCEVESPQYQWLSNNLVSSVCSVGVWHHPTATSGIHRGVDDISRTKDMEELLLANGMDIILNGHDHHYERISRGSAREFIVGTGGMSLRKTYAPYAVGSEKIIDDSFGYLYLELFPGRYEWKFKNTIGDVLDEGSQGCLNG